MRWRRPFQRVRTEDAGERRELLVGRLNILDGLDRALSRWAEVSVLAFASQTVEELIDGLMELLDIDEAQARSVADLQVRRTAALERRKIADELAQCRALLADLENESDEAP